MKLLKDSGIYVLGEILSKLIPFLLLPYLTRKLGPGGYGELANIQAYIVLMVVFVGLSQQGSVARYFYFYGKRSIGLVISSGMLFSLTFSVPFIIYSLWFENLFLLYVVLASLSQTFLQVQLALRQCQKRALDYTAIQLLCSFTNVIITVLLFELLAPKYEYRVLAIIFANLAAFLIGYYLYGRGQKIKLSFSWRLRKKGVKYLLAFGFPLIFHQLSFFMKGQLDRILIYDYFSAEELGIYAAGFQLASIFSILLMAINKAMLPYFYQGLKEKTIQLSKVFIWFRYSLLIVAIPAACAYFIPEFVYEYLLGSDFLGAKYFTVIFLLGLGFNIPYLLLVNYLFYYGKNKNIAYCTVASSLLYVAFVYIFISRGLNWVPVALLISNVFLIAVLYVYCKQLHSKKA
jgi:O-antigen/teichoic acid export membrane protein